MKFLDYFEKKYPSLTKHFDDVKNILSQLDEEDSSDMSDSLQHILTFFDDNNESAHSHEKDFHYFAQKVEEISGVEINECRDLSEAIQAVLDHGDAHESAMVIYLSILAIVYHTSKQ